MDQTSAFPWDVITEKLVGSKVIITRQSVYFYEELIIPLVEQNCQDLAHIIERKLARYHYREPGWKGSFKRFDRKYLQGNLAKFN